MAIIIQGQTKCKICNAKIQRDELITSFPAFVINKCDAHYFFSDESFHKDCFDNHRLSQSALEFLIEYDKGIENKICFIDKSELVLQNIGHPDNVIFLGLLTSNSSSSLFKYNFKYLNKWNFEKWNEMSEFLKFIDNEKSGLSYLTKLFNGPISPARPIGD